MYIVKRFFFFFLRVSIPLRADAKKLTLFIYTSEFHEFYWFHVSFLFLFWKWNGLESVFRLWSMLAE